MSIVSRTAAAVRPTPQPTGLEPVDWPTAMKRAIRDPAELCSALELPEPLVARAVAAARHFGLFAPHEYVAKIEPGNPNDPLLRQVLPLGAELHEAAGFSADPVGDLDATRGPGLLHKYRGRVLLIVTGACPVHCRYCFRRHFPYSEGPRSLSGFASALEEIASDNSIEEVIFSGGDPLTVVDARLRALAELLAEIPHVRRLRIHTRMPIMIPQRVTAELRTWLSGTRLAPIVVVHANHPREIDVAVADSLVQLADAGVTLLNQSVLLRGVNDDADTLSALSRRLFDARVLPYYLHQLDRVLGAAHFEVPEEEARALVAAMRRRLPGYLLPRYVREEAGEPHKTVIA